MVVKRLGILQDPRFFLKVAFVFLVVSIVLPYSAESYGLLVHWNPAPSWPAGYALSQGYKNWAFRWSFMLVRVTVPDSVAHPYDYEFVGTHWSYFLGYWDFYGDPVISITLLSIFILQLALIPLLFITWRRASTVLSLMPLFLGGTLLNGFYLYIIKIFGSLSFGFCLSFFANGLILAALTQMKELI